MPDKSPDIKTFYTNGFGFVLGDNDLRLTIGISKVEEPNSLLESAEIFMTHRTMKILSTALSQMIAHYESTEGEIAVDQKRLDLFKASLKENTILPTEN